MRWIRFGLLISIVFTNICWFAGCDDTIHGCDPSTDYCSCQKDHEDCHEAECWEEEADCEANKSCRHLSNCIGACKTDECPECYEMYGDGEKDLNALLECDEMNCGLCPR